VRTLEQDLGEVDATTAPFLESSLEAFNRSTTRMAASHPHFILDADAQKKAHELSKGLGAQERMALLGVILGKLVDVPFDDVAVLVGMKAKRLTRVMHGEEQIPKLFDRRWDMLAEMLENLGAVLRSEATGRWLGTPIPRLEGRTPLDAIQRGGLEAVVAVTRSYLDPSFG